VRQLLDAGASATLPVAAAGPIVPSATTAPSPHAIEARRAPTIAIVHDPRHARRGSSFCSEGGLRGAVFAPTRGRFLDAHRPATSAA